MDWALAIGRNRLPLLRIVAALFAMIGLGETGVVARVSRPVYRAVLMVLRPAEAAVRRLIVVAARGMVVAPKAARPAVSGRMISTRKGQGRVSFQLFDPRRVLPGDHGRYHAGARGNPRARFIDVVFDPRIPLFRPAPRSRRMNPIRRKTIPSMPVRCAADLPPSAQRSKICRARRNAMPAG